MRLPPTPREAASLRQRLLAHYQRSSRDLPWRATSDPYSILVSEVMLQQTTVKAVLPYYRRFLRRFPDLGTLARADEEDVLASWSGLGYYARARRLHAAAKEVMSGAGGQLPSTYQGLLRLPGVGPYTAGAVASIAFGEPVPVLDGNVRRVLSRLAGVLGEGPEQALLREAAARLVRGPCPGDLNQALMELGATVCTARSPGCGDCPVRRSCRGRRLGRPQDFPRSPRRAAPEQRQGTLVALLHEGGIVLVRRPQASLLSGLWELPGVTGYETTAPGTQGAGVVKAAVLQQTGLRVKLGAELGRFRHTVLNRRVDVAVLAGRVLRSPMPVSGRTYVWRPGEWLPPLTAAGRKALNLAQGRGTHAPGKRPSSDSMARITNR